MALLKIPDRYAKGLARLASLSDAYMDQLVGVLAATEPSGTVDDVAASVASKIEWLSVREANELVNVIFSLGATREGLQLSPGQLVESVNKAMLQSNRKELTVPEERLEQFRNGLTRLLDLPLVRAFSKVGDLVSDYERLFCKARVLTDVRPIFESDPGAPPTAVLITHTLRLTYHDVEGTKEIYITFQENELAGLQTALERAQEKARVLRSSTLDKAKVPIINVD